MKKKILEKISGNILFFTFIFLFSTVLIFQFGGQKFSLAEIDYDYEANPNFCTDTDAGMDYFIKGVIDYKKYNSSGAIEATSNPGDICVDAYIGGVLKKGVLREYYCQNDGTVNYEHEECENGCLEGACIGEEKFSVRTESDQGDYIGQGEMWNFSTENNSKLNTINADENKATFKVEDFSISYMDFQFASEDGKNIKKGLYYPAKRFPFRDSYNGIAVGGDGRGCNKILGAFYVHEYVLDNNGDLAKAAIDFVQDCEPGNSDLYDLGQAKLYGSLRYNSDFPESCNDDGCAKAKYFLGFEDEDSFKDSLEISIDENNLLSAENDTLLWSTNKLANCTLMHAVDPSSGGSGDSANIISTSSENKITYSAIMRNFDYFLENKIDFSYFVNCGDGEDTANSQMYSVILEDEDDSRTLKPDLTVTDIKFSANNKGEKGTLSVVIKNIGGDLFSTKGILNMSNDFTMNGFEFDGETPSITSFKSTPNVFYINSDNSLRNEEEITFSWIGIFNKTGNINIAFTVDAADELDEINESNNSLVKSIIIKEEENQDENSEENQDENSKENQDSNNKESKQLREEIEKLKQQVLELERKLTVLDQKFADKYKGTMFLDVENHGRLWYVEPESRKRYYFEDGEGALETGSKLATGITYEDILKIPVGIPEKLYNLKDSDGDGLPDRLESALGTNPNNVDTDGDGYSDSNELKNKYNPLNGDVLLYNKTLINRFEGKMLLQVSGPNSHGEIWYIKDGKRWYGGTEDSMYEIMKAKSLGATAENIRKIEVAELE